MIIAGVFKDLKDAVEVEDIAKTSLVGSRFRELLSK